MFGKLSGLGVLADSILHLIVAAFILIIQFENLETYHDSKVPATLLTGVIAAAAIQALYHVGLTIRAFCGTNKFEFSGDGLVAKKVQKKEELPAGEIARNIITGSGLILSAALYGNLDSRGVGVIDNNWQAWVSVLAWFVMRLFDTHMNGKYADEDGKDVAGRFKSLLEHTCKTDEEKLFKYFTPRIIIVHLLLAAVWILGFFVILNNDAGEIRNVKDPSYTDIFIATILALVHFGLYPAAALLNSFGVAVYCCGGQDPLFDDKQKCSGTPELISLNRIPIVRSLVAGTVLILLAYAYGHLYEGNQGTHILFLDLVLYVAADQIGFDVV
tara:strand:+ start:3525 stop:4511 length:987 start_codon:yes stop_codon:yes gene_type:complete